MNMMGEFQAFMSNPQDYVIKRMGIPADVANDPNKAIQHLMNTGRISQAQYNMARSQASQLQGNPMFQKLFRK